MRILSSSCFCHAKKPHPPITPHQKTKLTNLPKPPDDDDEDDLDDFERLPVAPRSSGGTYLADLLRTLQVWQKSTMVWCATSRRYFWVSRSTGGYCQSNCRGSFPVIIPTSTLAAK